MASLQPQDVGSIPTQQSGLRVWHCHSCGVGPNCGWDLTPCPGTSICQRGSQKREKTRQNKWKAASLYLIVSVGQKSWHSVTSWFSTQSLMVEMEVLANLRVYLGVLGGDSVSGCIQVVSRIQVYAVWHWGPISLMTVIHGSSSASQAPSFPSSWLLSFLKPTKVGQIHSKLCISLISPSAFSF